MSIKPFEMDGASDQQTDVNAHSHYANPLTGKLEINLSSNPGDLKIKDKYSQNPNVEIFRPELVEPHIKGEQVFELNLRRFLENTQPLEVSNGKLKTLLTDMGLETMFTTNSWVEIMADLETFYKSKYKEFQKRVKEDTDLANDIFYLSSQIINNQEPTNEILVASYILATDILQEEKRKLNKMVGPYIELEEKNISEINKPLDKDFTEFVSEEEKNLEEYYNKMKEQGVKVVFAERARNWVYEKIIR